MAYYAIVSVTATSFDWQAAYAPAVLGLVHKHRGRYLARTTDHHRLEGDGPSPALWVIIEFPSEVDAMGFYEDPEYQPFLQSRLAGSTSSFFMIDGRDQFDPANGDS